MPETTITVAEVRAVKTGERNGRPWTLFAVKDASGREYTTFETAWQNRIGQAVSIEYEIVRKDEFTNYWIKDAKKPEKIPERPKSTDQVVALLTEIRDLLRGQREGVPF